MIGKFVSQHEDILLLILVSWSIKLLLMPAYYSTDFAVHQNWLRITHELPLSQWYYNTESKWTLDYPPMFAYFEYLLSLAANAISPSIVKTINQLPETVLFQRVSVIVTDLIYLWSLLLFSDKKITLKIALMYLWIPFIILDNVHFQYNLAMQALLIVSVGMMNKGRFLWAAFCFSLLLNFKHIYLYCAPAFFVYLIKEYTFGKPRLGGENQLHVFKFVKVAVVTVVPFIVSFGPFLVVGGIDGIKQIFSRLFPFSRGLVHQYWAPNFWSLYYFLDKILVVLGIRKHDIFIVEDATATEHPIQSVNILKSLPQISPSHTIILILLFLAPIILIFLLSKKRVQFPQLVALSGLIFFYFGFHVHEKAIAPYINLLFFFTETACINAAIFVNIVNLVPLLIQPEQKVFCILVCLLWIALWDFLDRHKRDEMVRAQEKFIREMNMSNARDMALLYIQYVIEISGMLLVLFHLLVHPNLTRKNIQFLPFMMNSVWAAVFNSAWIGFLYWKFIDQYGIHQARSLTEI